MTILSDGTFNYTVSEQDAVLIGYTSPPLPQLVQLSYPNLLLTQVHHTML